MWESGEKIQKQKQKANGNIWRWKAGSKTKKRGRGWKDMRGKRIRSETKVSLPLVWKFLFILVFACHNLYGAESNNRHGSSIQSVQSPPKKQSNTTSIPSFFLASSKPYVPSLRLTLPPISLCLHRSRYLTKSRDIAAGN